MPDERSIAEVVAEVRAKAERATPGPWGTYGDGSDITSPPDTRLTFADGSQSDVAKAWTYPYSPRGDDGTGQRNAAFIVAACNNALRLCDEIEYLQRQIETVRRINNPAWRGFMKGGE